MSSFSSIPLSGITKQNRGGSSSTIVDSHDRIAVRAPPSHENDPFRIREIFFIIFASANTTFLSLMEIRSIEFHRFSYFLERLEELFKSSSLLLLNLKLTISSCLDRFETILKYSSLVISNYFEINNLDEVVI